MRDDLHFALTSFDGTIRQQRRRRLLPHLQDPHQYRPERPDGCPVSLFGHIDDGAPLTVTGRSLGGALATLLAVDMFVNAHLRPEVWTFGSPKVGDATFAATYGYHATVSWRITTCPTSYHSLRSTSSATTST